MNAALAVIAGFAVLAVGLALRARRGRDMNLEQWTVGGRGFGTLFVFLLMAGEIYSTFTFLGGAGLVYGSGGAAYYILGYGTLAYVLSYWLLPAVWRYATPRKLLSQSEFFVSSYDSRALGVVASLVAVAAMIPYLALQLKGLGIIVDATSYGSISSTAAVWIGNFAVTLGVSAVTRARRPPARRSERFAREGGEFPVRAGSAGSWTPESRPNTRGARGDSTP